MASDNLRPSTGHHRQVSGGTSSSGRKRAPTLEEDILPLYDHNDWYFPAHGRDSSDEEGATAYSGNWGQKHLVDARWVKRGKMVAWGPEMDDWTTENQARERVKALLPHKRSPSPPTLPHLRESVPLVAPYPIPITQHLSYMSFVMDKAVTHSFRSTLLDELEQTTNGLIEGEATLRTALGQLWQAINDSSDGMPPGDTPIMPKQEEEDEREHQDERQNRLARAPDLGSAVHRLFLSDYPVAEPSQLTSPELQQESLDKALATLRELQDDGREYVERLQEIREGLGDAGAQRDALWNMIREKAIKELQAEALRAAA